MIEMMNKHSIFLLFYLFTFLPSQAQTVRDLIIQKPTYASCNYDTYPDSIPDNLTPSPQGKKPFYISHYGRHGSRYINSRSGYDTPFRMMAHADSVNELTPIGERVFDEMKLIMDDTEGRWGELTSYGKKQHREIAHRQVERFHEFLELHLVDILAQHRMIAGIAHDVHSAQVGNGGENGVRTIQQCHLALVIRLFALGDEHM